MRYDTGLISSVDKDGKPRSGKTSSSLKKLEDKGLIQRKGHAIIINLPDGNKGYHLIYSWVLLDKLKDIGEQAFTQFCLLNSLADRKDPIKGVICWIGYHKLKERLRYTVNKDGILQYKEPSDNTISGSNKILVKNNLIEIIPSGDGNKHKRHSNKYKILFPAIDKKQDERNLKNKYPDKVIPFKSKDTLTSDSKDKPSIGLINHVMKEYKLTDINTSIANSEIKQMQSMGFSIDEIKNCIEYAGNLFKIKDIIKYLLIPGSLLLI
ncbi:MAG: hypothetical protein VR67_17050 [Peptococcaceae bacterium BRH_c8a]|nr:MAG: hypothetical protein VR67_17050 [Peptococcaceae bacterium BRH_c8a]